MEVGERALFAEGRAIYRADGEHPAARVSFVLPSGQLKDEPATWYGGVHVEMNRIPTMERALFAAYPTVTVINIADVLSRIETVVDQITFVVRFLAGFSILAGLMILASSIASARFRRMREAVVLKTLGATRMRIVRTFSVEFSVLGLLAGSVGVVFANILTRVLLRRLEVAFHLDWNATLFALVGTAILATAPDGSRAIASSDCGRSRSVARRIDRASSGASRSERPEHRSLCQNSSLISTGGRTSSSRASQT